MSNGKKLEAASVFSVQWVAFPVFIFATTYAMWWAQFTGFSQIAVQMIAFVTTIVFIEILEHWLPLIDNSSKKDYRDGRVNLTSMIILMAVVDPFLKVLSPLVISILIVSFGLPEAFVLFPNSWHFIPQLVFAALVSELGQYWMHRLGHVSWLWRFHSFHHSSIRMNWLTGFRAHPFNMIWHHFAGVFVLVLIGTNEAVLLTYLALGGVLNIFQHSNVCFKYGFLNYVFSTNELHRWHHSTVIGEANANYGALLIVWDIVFGSYFNNRLKLPNKFGLFSGTNYPVNSYWRQLIVPMFWRRWNIDGKR